MRAPWFVWWHGSGEGPGVGSLWPERTDSYPSKLLPQQVYLHFLTKSRGGQELPPLTHGQGLEEVEGPSVEAAAAGRPGVERRSVRTWGKAPRLCMVCGHVAAWATSRSPLTLQTAGNPQRIGKACALRGSPCTSPLTLTSLPESISASLRATCCLECAKSSLPVHSAPSPPLHPPSSVHPLSLSPGHSPPPPLLATWPNKICAFLTPLLLNQLIFISLKECKRLINQLASLMMKIVSPLPLTFFPRVHSPELSVSVVEVVSPASVTRHSRWHLQI